MGVYRRAALPGLLVARSGKSGILCLKAATSPINSTRPLVALLAEIPASWNCCCNSIAAVKPVDATVDALELETSSTASLGTGASRRTDRC